MNTKNSLDVIGLIVSLILSDSFSASVETLADACNIPIPKMRKYISVIFDNKILLSHFSPSLELDEDADDSLDINSSFLAKIKSGQADKDEIFLIGLDDFIDEYHLLPITSIEAGYLGNAYPDLIKNQRTPLFEIKDTIDSIPKPVLEKQDKTQDAILQKRKIAFDYKSPKFDLAKIICSPVAVIQNLTTHILYIKDTENNYYRIDRIKSNIKILQEPSDIDHYMPNPDQKYFWGNEYQEHGNPVHVKLQISAGTSNILEKIKNDTALRKATGKFYMLDNNYYYEDDILGIPDFRRWLRSYGSSIKIIEPQSLIDEITEGAKKTLSFYKALGNTNA